MAEDRRLNRGLPNRDAVVELLNDSYGDWGKDDHFRWKYDEYPGFVPERVFWVVEEDALVAFRRVFNKELIGSDGRRYPFSVLGDTCVAPAHRGEGMYSLLHTETVGYCEDKGRDFCCTFNRRGNVTYSANLDRGWSYRTLPLRLKILSPTVVLPEYAKLVVEESDVATQLLNRLTSAVRSKRSECGRSSATRVGQTMPIQLFVAACTEMAASDSPFEALQRRTSVPWRWTDGTHGRSNIATRTVQPDQLDVATICDLYEGITGSYDLHFRREREDVEHMLGHPQLDSIVTARRNGELVGIAPVAVERNRSVLEAGVLDAVATDDEGFKAVIDGVEATARRCGADVVLLLSETNPGATWATVDRQVLMWKPLDSVPTNLRNRTLKIGLYDIV